MDPERPQLAEMLQFRPKLWWDPVPPWLFQYLDKELIVEVARVQLDFQRVALEQQLEAVGKVAEIIGRIK